MLVKETIELEDTFLESKPGEPPHAWLLIWHVRHFRAKIRGTIRRWRTRKRDVCSLSGTSRAHVNRQILAYAKRRGVVLIPDQGTRTTPTRTEAQ